MTLELFISMSYIVAVGILGLVLFHEDSSGQDSSDLHTQQEVKYGNFKKKDFEDMDGVGRVCVSDVKLETKDALWIAGSFLEVESSKAVLLLHMMPETKESYSEFQKKLAKAGFSSLAIDLRGHGESEGGPNGYKGFSNVDHRASLLDVRVASEFLEEEGYNLSNQFVVGASIGANLALQFGSRKNIKKIVALSPGINYSGIKTEPEVADFSTNQSVLFAVSRDDKDRDRQAEKLVQKTPEDVGSELVMYKHAGHGTDMFGKEVPDLESKIIEFLRG